MTFPNLGQMVSIPSSVALFQIQPKLRPLVPLAIERAIREIINAVAERSVTISCLTTREVVLKDLCAEGDENVVRKSAQLMVGCLAGSLALVTCREPFRAALTSHLKAMLTPGMSPSDSNEQALVEQVVQVITAENLDLGCLLVERAVYERAVREINDTISMPLQARRLHREQQAILASASGGLYTPTTFMDASFSTSSASLPAQQLNIYMEFRDLMLKMEASIGNMPALGPHPSAAVSQTLVLPAVVPRQQPPPPPPPAHAAPVGGLPSLAQVQQLLQSVKSQAENREETVELRELKLLLSRNLDELVTKLSLTESVLTLPEIVENQPFQLDAYYGLISLGFNAEWLEFLRRVQVIIARDPSLAITSVWLLTKAITERFDNFTSLVVPLALPPVRPSGDSNSCSVSEEHLFLELALAVMALLAPVLGGDQQDSVGRAVHTPVMAWLMEMLFSKLTEAATDSARSAMLTIILGALRYSLVKEAEMDRMLARLLTEHRTIATTGFVVYLLQVFTCRMRMSPLQNWPITTEVIFKMLQRVTAAGPLIPQNEKGLATQLDSFSKEMKAVANVSADRISAYRQLHCLSTRPPEPLPWDIVANQAMVMPVQFAHPSGDLLPVSISTDDRKRVFLQLYKDMKNLEIFDFKEIPHQFVCAVWASLRAAGCEMDGPAAPGPLQAQIPDWVELLFHSVILQALAEDEEEEGEAGNLDSAIALLMAVCHRGDVTVHELRPLDILRCKYVRKLWDVVASLIYMCGKKSLNQKFFARLLSLTLQDALAFRPESTAYTNAVVCHFAKTLGSVAPQFVPMFTFAWLDLLAARHFMPLVLGLKGQRGWRAFAKLLLEGLTFVSAAIEQVSPDVLQMPESVKLLLTGTERILSIIHSDFPEFFVLYADQLIVSLTAPCAVRIKNLILAACPKNVRFVDPFTTAVKLDNLPDGRVAPRVVVADQLAGNVTQLVLKYATNSSRDRSILVELRALAGDAAASSFCPLLFFVGVKLPGLVKQQLNGGGGVVPPVTLSLDILMDLALNLETGPRRAFLSALVDMLRYPSSQTSVFSIALLFIFAESGPSAAALKEDITKTLVSRLIVERPHPWGLLATFSELVKNPRFAFWKQDFVKGETEALLKRIATLCFTPDQEQAGGPSPLQKIVDQQRKH